MRRSALVGEPLVRLLRALVVFAAACAVGCPSGVGRSDSLDTAAMPEGVRADYAVFAQRCSKCHSLARPLNSGIDDDAYWVRYVARMRAQPGSGISAEDSVVILRFLHVYSLEQRREKEASRSTDAGPAAEPPVALPDAAKVP